MITRYVIAFRDDPWPDPGGYFRLRIEGKASDGKSYSIDLASLDWDSLDWCDCQELDDTYCVIIDPSDPCTGEYVLERLAAGLNSREFEDYIASL